MMHLRDATRADLAALRELNESAVPAVNSLSEEAFAWFFEAADYFRLIEIEQTLAGFLLGLRPGLDYASQNYTWFSRHYRDFCYIDRLAVDARFRRRGIASALYTDIERHALVLGAPALACEVNVRPRNEVSLAFHNRHGFREVGQQDTEGGEKRVALMIKPLASTVAV